jgi:hypothetical protein
MSYKTDGGRTSDGNIILKLSDYQSLREELEALKAAGHSIICMVDGLYVSDELENRIHKFELLSRSSNK